MKLLIIACLVILSVCSAHQFQKRNIFRWNDMQSGPLVIERKHQRRDTEEIKNNEISFPLVIDKKHMPDVTGYPIRQRRANTVKSPKRRKGHVPAKSRCIFPIPIPYPINCGCHQGCCHHDCCHHGCCHHCCHHPCCHHDCCHHCCHHPCCHHDCCHHGCCCHHDCCHHCCPCHHCCHHCCCCNKNGNSSNNNNCCNNNSNSNSKNSKKARTL